MEHLRKFNENTLTSCLDDGTIKNILNLAQDEGLHVVIDQESEPDFTLLHIYNYSDNPSVLEFEDPVLDQKDFYELCENINIRLNVHVEFEMLFCAWDQNDRYREYSEIKNLDDYRLVETIFISKDGQDVYL